MTAPSIKEALEAFVKAYGAQDSHTKGLDDATALARAALSTLSPPAGERREAIARAISWLRKFRFMSYNTGFLWMADDAEKIASLLESLASGLVQDEAYTATLEQKLADAVRDNAAIRADERERCATIADISAAHCDEDTPWGYCAAN